jgi:hypothetical protein
VFTFPTALFAPQSIRPQLLGGAVSGGQSLSGITQLAATSGGPFWGLELGGVTLNTREKMKAWRAVEAMSDNGATSFVVPLCDRGNQPFLNPRRTDGFTGDKVFSEGTSWTISEITATASAAALRATELTLASYSGGATLVGGEHFTIVHPTLGARLYRIGSVSGATITIRPPLREAISSGTVLDFDNARCVMRVEGDMSAALELLKRGTGSVRFLESFGA